MKNKLCIPVLMAIVFSTGAKAQEDSLYIRHVVDTLTSRYFYGRGYLDNGMGKAADYLQQQFTIIGLQPLKGNSYAQPFSYPVNTFPGKVAVAINGRRLVPGADFIPTPESRGVKTSSALVQKDDKTFVDAAHRLIVRLENKLTWSVEPQEVDYTLIQVDSSLFVNSVPQTINIDLENKVIKNFQTANLAGMVKGTQYPDSILFITAHYDHLGGLGKDTYFPGANDNASGIGMLLNLARYYAQHPQPYTIGFICFAGEEAGILGSKYYTEHPLAPLKNISFLLNLDLNGTGEEGITVVNGPVYKKAFTILKTVNDQQHYLPAVNERGEAANSDHYFFSKNGVPAFFIYTMGGIKAYHDVFDKAGTLPLTKVNGLTALIKEFFTELQQTKVPGK